jgi:type II secretory pathway component PulM
MKLLRTLLVLLLSLAPILFWLLVWRPAETRMAANRARIAEAEARIQELPRYTPLSAEEAAFLEDPSAPWRQRIPRVLGTGTGWPTTTGW